MARMPQIPETNLGPIPGGSVGRAPLPSVDGVAGAVGIGADALATASKNLAREEAAQQKILQDAADQKQAIVDTVTATRSASNYEEKLRGVLTKLQEQYWDKGVENVPTMLLAASRELADGDIKAAPNSVVARALAQSTSSLTNSMMTRAHEWVSDRQTQKLKSDLTGMMNDAAGAAEAQSGSLPGLEAAIAAQHKRLDFAIDHASDNPAKAKAALDHDMTEAWARKYAQDDPVHALQMLDATKGTIVHNLKSTERDEIRKLADATWHGLSTKKLVDTLKRGIDQTGDAYELVRSGEWTPSVARSMLKEIEDARDLYSTDPNITEPRRKELLAGLDVRQKTISALDLVSRKQPGFDPLDSEAEGARSKLFEDYHKLFKGDAAGTTKDLGAILKFRHDVADAALTNDISRQTFDTLDKAVSNALGNSRTKEAGNTATVGATVLGRTFSFAFPWQAPRQAGNSVLLQYTTEKGGPLGKFTPKQANDAQERYMEQLNDASDRQQVVDEKTARQMALDAAYYVKGRHR